MYNIFPEEDKEWRRVGQMRTKLLRMVFFHQRISKIQMSDMFGLRGARNIDNNVYGNSSGNR